MQRGQVRGCGNDRRGELSPGPTTDRGMRQPNGPAHDAVGIDEEHPGGHPPADLGARQLGGGERIERSGRAESALLSRVTLGRAVAEQRVGMEDESHLPLPAVLDTR
jgi:hypothetical protein